MRGRKRILAGLFAGFLCLMSVAGALIYSRYITKPVVAQHEIDAVIKLERFRLEKALEARNRKF